MDTPRTAGSPDPGPDWTRPDPTPRAAAKPAAQQDRHVLIGVSHPSNDPARHRVFDIRASFDPAAGGWVANVGEQDRNEQPAAWSGGSASDLAAAPFPNAAACLGDAVRQVVAAVDRDAALP